jgi:hypothetical protein
MAAVIAPSGLPPCSKYQWVFVTVPSRIALSSDIDDYNSFLVGQVNYSVGSGLPIGLTWHAVVSTPNVNARDNARSTGLVYNKRRELVASTGLYLGSVLAPIYYNQAGASYGIGNAFVWTGSDPSVSGS